MLNKKKSSNFIALTISWYIFISHLDVFSITQYSAILKLLILVFSPLLFILLNVKNLKFGFVDIIWIYSIIIFGYGAFISPDLGMGIFSMIKLLVFYLIFLYLLSPISSIEKIIKYFFIFSGIHVLFTILSFLIPNFIKLINGIILSSQSADVSLQLQNYGFHSGIAGQTSFNAMYITIFISILFARLLIYNDKRSYLVNGILVVIGVIALFLSSKRGALLAVIVAVFIAFTFCLLSSNRKKAKTIFLNIIIVITLYVLIKNIPQLQRIFERFTLDGDFTSNRISIYSFMIERIKENLFFGKGTGSLSSELDISGHNMYLQLIYENGFIGFISIMSLFCMSLFTTIKLLKNRYLDSNLRYFLLTSLIFQISFLVYGLTESVFVNPTMLAPYVVMIAIPFKLKKIGIR